MTAVQVLLLGSIMALAVAAAQGQQVVQAQVVLVVMVARGCLAALAVQALFMLVVAAAEVISAVQQVLVDHLSVAMA
jgi:hypothetical protein